MVEVIAKIESTSLGTEDHGIFTCWLHVNYGGSGQGIGGYSLDGPSGDGYGRVGSAEGMNFIMRLMDACGVDDWKKLPGRTVYVLKDSDKWGADVLGIRPLPAEPGKEFIFADAFQNAVSA
jgi:hypothetical protein